MKRVLGTCIGALAVLALLFATGCGDSDNDSSAASNADVKRQLDALMDGFRAALKAKDGEEACELLSAGSRKEYAAYVPFGGGGVKKGGTGSCAAGYHLMAKQDIMEDVTPKIVATKIGDRRASITGHVSHLDELQTAVFVKEGGEWKISTWFKGKR
jgi:hypothetical protein